MNLLQYLNNPMWAMLANKPQNNPYGGYPLGYGGVNPFTIQPKPVGPVTPKPPMMPISWGGAPAQTPYQMPGGMFGGALTPPALQTGGKPPQFGLPQAQNKPVAPTPVKPTPGGANFPSFSPRR